MGVFCTTADPTMAAVALATGVMSSGTLGLHMTHSIGGADMPVVITLLNSYSGWALCAEGFILDQPLLTVVGALIGSSGAFLTRVMCEAMNRSLGNVILGGFGTVVKKKEGAQEVLVHTEIDATGTAEALRNADKICIVPGYGLAVAHAGGVVADIALGLRKQVTLFCSENHLSYHIDKYFCVIFSKIYSSGQRCQVRSAPCCWPHARTA
jgi:H+-translocating NAD(P) transhydrogenase